MTLNSGATSAQKTHLVGSEENTRTPLTQEFLATTLAETPNHPLRKEFEQALYDSIFRLIRKQVYRFKTSIRDEGVDDLSQKCLIQIFENLHKYDPSLSKFTTWSYKVAENLLTKQVRNQRREDKVFCKVQEDDIFYYADMGYQDESVEVSEMADLVLELIEEHPKQEAIIRAMFGDPEDLDSFSVPDQISMAAVARAAGVSSNQVYAARRRILAPAIQKKLKRMKKV